MNNSNKQLFSYSYESSDEVDSLATAIKCYPAIKMRGEEVTVKQSKKKRSVILEDKVGHRYLFTHLEPKGNAHLQCVTRLRAFRCAMFFLSAVRDIPHLSISIIESSKTHEFVLCINDIEVFYTGYHAGSKKFNALVADLKETKETILSGESQAEGLEMVALADGQIWKAKLEQIVIPADFPVPAGYKEELVSGKERVSVLSDPHIPKYKPTPGTLAMVGRNSRWEDRFDHDD